MKYDKMTNPQIERVFAKDVLGWYTANVYPKILWWMEDGKSMMYQSDFRPLTDLNHAMLGVKRLADNNDWTWGLRKNMKWHSFGFYEYNDDISEEVGHAYADTPQAAIVEACIRIVRPDLFEGD